MNRVFSLACLFLLIFAVSLKADWQRPITNYTRYAYKAGNQNWDIQQHDNGWIYVANNKGLLEYDGVEWNTYPIHNAKTCALKIGADKRIYIGGMEQFGYFSPNKLGRLDYTCLSDSLPSGTSVGVIWNILTDRNRVYFQSDRCIHYLEGNKINQINPLSEIYTSLVVNNKFYIVSENGLMVMNGTKFLPVSGASKVDTAVKSGGLLSYQEKLIIVTRDKGLFIYDGATLQKYKTAADNFCSRNQLFCAALKDSLLALGSIQGGVCLLNLKTNEVEVISTNNGLQNKTVLSMAFDKVGHLWLGLDNGIDCIHLNEHIASLYGGKSVIGSGYTSYNYRGRFYMGTNQGIYTTILPIRLNQDDPINFVPGTGGQVWSFRGYDDKLFCCSDNGLFIMDGSRMEHIAEPKGIWDVVQLPRHEDVLIAGTYAGLYLLKKENGKWRVKWRISGLICSCKDMLVEALTDNTLWIANKENGVFRVILSEDLSTVKSFKNYNNDMFPAGYDARLTHVGNDIVVTSHEGLWRYNQTHDSLERFLWLENLLDGKAPYTYLKVDALKNIWYVTNGELKVMRYDTAGRKYYRVGNETFLRGALIENFEDIYPYNRTQFVVGTEDGFSLIDQNRSSLSSPSLNLQIRKVYVTKQRDSLVYGRSYLYSDEPVVIPYSCNALRIEYGANNYNKTQILSYSCRLSRGGEDAEWSAYSENNMKEFTSLPEGKYVFSVKLLTDENEIPIETSFAFEILPPWYRTWWSYVVYAIVVALLSYYVYYRIAIDRKYLLIQKELELYKQRQKFEEESDLKDRTIDSLKEENLKAELRHKSEELIRTTLNIVRKNEMLLGIKKEVLNMSHSINEENMVALRRKAFRLLGQIETNIEHDDDLQMFQGTFDSVHHDFFHCCPLKHFLVYKI